jgi:hypothetical protein
MGVPTAWSRVREQLANAVRATNPDVVHAHNIFSAELAREMHLPMIYDDHEYWSLMMKAELEGWQSDSFHYPSRLPRNLMHRYGEWLWKRWESRVIRETPAITVCEATAEAHTKRGAHDVFVVPNLLCEEEAREIPRMKKTRAPLTAVAVGNDFTTPMRIRDSRHLLDIFESASFGPLTVIGDPFLDTRTNVIPVKSLPHLAMLRELANHHVGIIGWKPHWFHKYCNPNKAYEYMHSGLIPVLPSSLTPVIQMCHGFAKTFSNYEELTKVLLTLSSNLEKVNALRDEIFTFSKKRLLWEQYEGRIFEAYAKVC